MTQSSYGLLGYMSILHATYLCCIKPYLTQESVVLEIGPGRGAWTRTFVSAREIWCLDALSAEHNGFWEFVGRSEKIKYIQVADFSCSMLPDNKFDYFFSFGTFCHISFEGLSEYMKNIYPKLVKGCQCFLMVADYEKYNRCIADSGKVNAFRILGLVKPEKRYKRLIWRHISSYIERVAVEREAFEFQPEIEDNLPRPARWYNAGVTRTCELLEKLGYRVLDPDMGVLHRDPMIHFCKPA